MDPAHFPLSARRFQRLALCRLMVERGWTQTELAMALPAPTRDLSRYMSGSRLLTPYWLARLGTVLPLTDAQFRALAEGVAMLEHARWVHDGTDGYRRHPLADAAFKRPT